MTDLVMVPPNLVPTELLYLKGMPKVIETIIDECLVHRKQGDVASAIRCANQAQGLAEAQSHYAGVSVVLVLLADMYREMDQIGLALECCQRAQEALRVQPNYEHRQHAEAVIIYLQCLLCHELGAHTKVFADYDRALKALESAVRHWNDSIARDYANVGEYQEMIKKCERVIEWINAMNQCLAGNLSPVEGGIKVVIPAANEKNLEVLCMQLPTLLLPLEATINRREYRLYHPNNGLPFSRGDRLEVKWDVRRFAVRVLKDGDAGPYSSQGDYGLVIKGKQVHKQVASLLQGTAPSLIGVSWEDNLQQWQYGKFIRDQNGNIRVESIPPIIIGGVPQSKVIVGLEIGIVCALLKPV